MFARSKLTLPPPPTRDPVKPRDNDPSSMPPPPPPQRKAVADLDAALAAKSHQSHPNKEISKNFTLIVQEKEKKAVTTVPVELPTGTKEAVPMTTAAAIGILGGNENQSSNTSEPASAMDLSSDSKTKTPLDKAETVSRKEVPPAAEEMNVLRTVGNSLKSAAEMMLPSSSSSAATAEPEEKKRKASKKDAQKKKRKREEEDTEDDEVEEPPKKKEKKSKKKSSTKKDKKDKKKKKKDEDAVPVVIQEKAGAAVPIDEAKAVDPFESKMDGSSSSSSSSSAANGGTTGAKIKPSDPAENGNSNSDEPEKKDKKKKKKKDRPAFKSTAMKKSLRQQGIGVIDSQPMTGKGVIKPKRHLKAGKYSHVIGTNCDGLTKPAIRRLARRGGVKRISDDSYEEAQAAQKAFLEIVIRDAVLYTEHMRRKTVMASDIIASLKRNGKTLFPTDGIFGRKTNSSAIRKHVEKAVRKIEKAARAASEKRKTKKKKPEEQESAATTTVTTTTIPSESQISA
jgi:histone H4